MTLVFGNRDLRDRAFVDWMLGSSECGAVVNELVAGYFEKAKKPVHCAHMHISTSAESYQ